MKTGALSRMLGIPEKENIPTMLLREIMSKEVGRVIYYKGKRIPVTKLLRQRANFALNVRQ